MFDERKAAQIAAWFLNEAGARMPHLKLMKLMYLAEREAMKRHGFPLTGDRFVCMPHGPVLSQTLNHINGYDESQPDGGWDSWVSDKANFCVQVRKPVTREALDELSDDDLAVLETVWMEFGAMDKWQIRDYTHKHCPEWEDPDQSSTPLPYIKVLRAVGYDAETAAALVQEITAHDRIRSAIDA